MKTVVSLLALVIGTTAAVGQTNDVSARSGIATTKWYPQFWGNYGVGLVYRFNRVFVGEATSSSSDIGPVMTKDWSEAILPNTVGTAMLASVDTTGQLAIWGASRSSDFRKTFGSATGGAQGLTGFGFNDDTGSGTPIAVGLNGIGVRAPGVAGITLGFQGDMNNGGSAVGVTPYGGIVGGSTYAGLLTSGAFSNLGTSNVSAGWAVGQGRPGGPVFYKGGLCFDGALDRTVGGGGNGVCIEMARNMSIRWLAPDGSVDGEITANASGLHVYSRSGTIAVNR